MRSLELVPGSGSLGHAFRAKGWEVVSLDTNTKSKAILITDIMTWNYKVPDVGEFDVIWSSPCCTQYSCDRRSAKTPRDLGRADSQVSQTRTYYLF